MPGTMDGIELAQYVRERWPCSILVVEDEPLIALELQLALDALRLSESTGL